jgi:dethiobiotin synthetase
MTTFPIVARPAATLRRAFLVTGTDTGVGKTLVSCALLRAAAQAGRSAAAIKPVAAGATLTAAGLRNDDALQLQAAATLQLSYEEVNPICLEPALAPHIAAAQAGRRLSVDRITGFCQGLLMQRADVTVVEGVGGWRVPLNDRETFADVAKRLQLPVILVVGMRLGCLNHALLTAEAIIRDGLTLAGWVANTLDPAMPARAENIETLRQQLLLAPLLADIPFLSEPPLADEAAPYINLRALGVVTDQ